MKSLHFSCQGESHILSGKVCQDASFSEVSSAMSIAIVCDGHGGKRYFRSDVGAKMAVESTKKCVAAFIEGVDSALFSGPFTQSKSVASQAAEGILDKLSPTDKAFRQLFSSIIYTWRSQIYAHSQEVPLTEEEAALLSAEQLSTYEQGQEIEKTYGCTLMCYVYTRKFWFAFHIGDGKCIAFNADGEWSEPIPWDDKCFLNKTTSLCDSAALDEFRYCYGGSFKTAPMAIFLGSDGIDDSFGVEENMVNFYIQVLKMLGSNNLRSAKKTIAQTLPELSRRGSQDDMSVACVYNERTLSQGATRLIEWQRSNVDASIYEENLRIIQLREKVAVLSEGVVLSKKAQIELRYAQQDLAKSYDVKRGLVLKWNKFSQELLGEGFTPYADVIGFEEKVDNEVEVASGVVPSDEPSEVEVAEVASEGVVSEVVVDSNEPSEVVASEVLLVADSELHKNIE